MLPRRFFVAPATSESYAVRVLSDRSRKNKAFTKEGSCRIVSVHANNLMRPSVCLCKQSMPTVWTQCLPRPLPVAAQNRLFCRVATCARRCGVTAGALRNFAYVCGFCKQSSAAKVRFASPVVPRGKAYCAVKHFPACRLRFAFFRQSGRNARRKCPLVRGGVSCRQCKNGRGVRAVSDSVMRHCLPSKCSFARVVKSNDLWYNKQQGIAFKRKGARSQRSSP